MKSRFIAALAAAGTLAHTTPTSAQDMPRATGSAKPAPAPGPQVRDRDLAGSDRGRGSDLRTAIEAR